MKASPTASLFTLLWFRNHQPQVEHCRACSVGHPLTLQPTRCCLIQPTILCLPVPHLSIIRNQPLTNPVTPHDTYPLQALGPAVYCELRDAVASNRWLTWDTFDQASPSPALTCALGASTTSERAGKLCCVCRGQ